MKLSNQTKEILKNYSQINQNILKKIVSLVKIENQSILEIGPGTGNLTSYILKNNPKKLLVVEKDKSMSRLRGRLAQLVRVSP